PVDLIVANLPYVRSAELPRLQPEVQHEPPKALDGGPDGLRVIQRLLLQVPTHLKPGGALVLEMDPRQAPRLATLATRLFPSARVHLERDLAGHDRALVIET
ncbi:MAG: protein-(glutamine-N5) methyltransferase, release factor-specific, partial [Dehalococcoidia bacterium]